MPPPFSAQDLAARLLGLSRDDKIAGIRQYLSEMRARRSQAGETFSFFEAEGNQGEAVFFGPGGMPGQNVSGIFKNVISVDAAGKVYRLTLKGLTPLDIRRTVPRVSVDLQRGDGELIAE